MLQQLPPPLPPLLLTVHDLSEQHHPSCFSFRNKPNTKEITFLPPPAHAWTNRNNDNTTHSNTWSVVRNVGRGTFGHAILMQRLQPLHQVKQPILPQQQELLLSLLSSSLLSISISRTLQQQKQELEVFKVDTARESLLWEALIHMQVMSMLMLIS